MARDTGARLCVLYDFDHSVDADPTGRTFDALFAAYTTLRHIQAVEAGEEAAAGTLGVGVLHHPREGRRYSFVLLEDTSLSLPADIRRSLESQFGVFNGKFVDRLTSLGCLSSSEACSPPRGIAEATGQGSATTLSGERRSQEAQATDKSPDPKGSLGR